MKRRGTVRELSPFVLGALWRMRLHTGVLEYLGAPMRMRARHCAHARAPDAVRAPVHAVRGQVHAPSLLAPYGLFKEVLDPRPLLIGLQLVP